MIKYNSIYIGPCAMFISQNSGHRRLGVSCSYNEENRRLGQVYPSIMPREPCYIVAIPPVSF